MNRWISSTAVRFLSLSLFCAVAIGAAVAQDAAKPKPARAKPKGRLPAHYGKLVDAGQKEKIYALQSEFAAKKEALQKQLDAIEAEETAAIEAVLTPAQKEKLAALQAQAKAAREKKAAEKKAGAGKAAEEKAAGEKPAPKAAAKKAA
ncbi:MAG: hypothetical protein DCC68_01915 [Planctomycetota bacterium]|nr:MAG: hypothetical protein DCC68_01915 [Planctomycetota bacterium]